MFITYKNGILSKQLYFRNGKNKIIDVAIPAIKSSLLNLLKALFKFNKPFY